MALRVGALLAIAVAILCIGWWLARTGDPPAIAVANAWARPAGLGETAAVYLEIDNSGQSPDRLTGVETEAAANADIHDEQMEGEVMRMRRVAAIDLVPGKPVAFAPGRDHIMLFDLKRKLAEGDSFPLTLVFDKSGRLAVQVRVSNQGAGP
jgi:hypothetical protein